MKHIYKTTIFLIFIIQGCSGLNQNQAENILSLIDNGNLKADCRITCGPVWGFNQEKALDMYRSNDFNSLGKLVGKIGHEGILSHYYLGYVSEKRGNLKSAIKFYKSSLFQMKFGYPKRTPFNILAKTKLGLQRTSLQYRELNKKFLNNKVLVADKSKIKNSHTNNSDKSLLVNLKQKRIQSEKKNQISEIKKKKIPQMIVKDNQEPIINISVKMDGSTAIISGTVTDNTEVEEVLVGNLHLPTFAGGIFEFKEYIPRDGKTIEIIAYDTKGNKASKLLKIERSNIQQASGPMFDTLNPSVKRVKSKPNALALIIGIANYEKTPANALYADKDAQQFYDYAHMKLGIPAKNIKELVNNKADRIEITLAIKDWISRSTKSGKSDIYLYFAGHGLATANGKNMFLLPYDGLPRLLQDSAIKRDQLFADIQKANPKSVTVFLDTCYSGVTRNEEMLIAGRPIMIKAKKQAIPEGFTLFSAASNEQISRPLEEAKHGMFSYFLMKGMEGDADSNNDNKITARELHAYVKQNVTQQSSGSQTPELQGDKDRVLVQFN